MVGFFYFFLKKERTKKAYFYSFILRLRNISPDLHSRLAVFPFFIFYFLFFIQFTLPFIQLSLISFFFFSFLFFFSFFFLKFFFPVLLPHTLLLGSDPG